MQTLSSREFNQDVSLAKRLARLAPLFITDRGRPTHVLVCIDTYRQMAGQGQNIVDLLAEDATPEHRDPPRSAWDRRAPVA